MKTIFKNKAVQKTFQMYPSPYKTKLMAIRELIFKIAKKSPEIGEITETLKWGEPSYLPKQRNIGTTIRLHWLETKPNQYGIYFNCQTNLIEQFKKKFGKKFQYEGKRALIFNLEDDLKPSEITDCIYMALTNKLKKN